MSRNLQWGVSEVGRRGYESSGEYETFEGEGEAYEGERESYYGEQEAQSEASELFYGEAEYGAGRQEKQQAEAVFDEAEEMELAAELLSVRNGQELDRLIRRLILSASKAVGGSIGRDLGSALGGSIKAATQQALSTIGGAGTAEAGELFGVEMEGLSGEDREFESARRIVRFSGAATGRAARAPRQAPARMAKDALTLAAQKWAPGLLRGSRFWQKRNRDWRGRPPWRRRDRPDMRYPEGVPAPASRYPYPAPYPPPGQQPGPGFDPNVAAGGGEGAPDSSGATGADQGAPISGAGPYGAAGGNGGTLPQTGRWTRQDGQLTIHI